MTELVEKDDVVPLCPHCETRLNEIWIKRLAGFLAPRYIYFCKQCHKTLSITHRKGFWMG